MTNSIIKEVLSYDINKVWSVVRNIEAYPQWRSDVFNVEILDSTRFIEYGKNAFPTTFLITKDVFNVEILDSTRFIEYGKNAFPTTFLITKEEEPFLWEFDIDNAKIHGHWIGMLHKTENGTEVEFTEAISVKKIIFKPFVKAYLKKQQSRFMEDLKNIVQLENNEIHRIWQERW